MLNRVVFGSAETPLSSSLLSNTKCSTHIKAVISLPFSERVASNRQACAWLTALTALEPTSTPPSENSANADNTLQALTRGRMPRVWAPNLRWVERLRVNCPPEGVFFGVLLCAHPGSHSVPTPPFAHDAGQRKYAYGRGLKSGVTSTGESGLRLNKSVEA